MSPREKRHLSGDSGDFVPLPPDGGYGWIVVFASFANHVIVDGITFTFGIFYSEFSEYFGGSKGQTSLVGALLAGCYLLTAPFAGSMVNKFGCRAVSITGSLIAATGFLTSTLATSVHLLTLTYGVIGGFGLGLLYLPNIIAVSYYFERRRAIATGIAVCGAGVGCFLMAPVGRWLLDVYDWKNAMYIVAGITLNGCVFGAMLRPLEIPGSLPSLQVTSPHDVTAVSSELQAVSNKDSGAILSDESDDVTVPVHRRLPVPVDSVKRSRSCSDAPIYYYKRRFVKQTSLEPKIAEQQASSATDVTGDVTSSSAQPGRSGVGISREAAGGLQTAGRLYKSDVCVGVSIERHQSQRRTEHRGPIYRKDIFYSGSTLRIPELSDVRRRSFLRPSSAEPETEIESTTEKQQQLSPCMTRCFCLPPLSRAIKDAWHEMTNLSLLKDPIFLVPCLGNIFGTIGLFVPFVYCADRAISLGVDLHSAAFLLSIIGITNTLGRIIAGVIASIKNVNSLLLHNIALLAAGLACMAQATFGVNYAGMASVAAIFGFCIATWISLTSVVLCDILGLERLTNAFGLLTMTRGLACMVGSPIAGFVFDATGNYDASFYVGGAMMSIGGALCCLLHHPYFQSTLGAEERKKSESGFEELEASDVHVESSSPVSGPDQLTGPASEQQPARKISYNLENRT